MSYSKSIRYAKGSHTSLSLAYFTPNLKLVSLFDELPLKDFDFSLKGHPAHSTTDLERLNVLNKLIGRIEESHDNSLAGMVMSEKQDIKFGDMFTWTDYLKIIIFATIGFLLLILLAYIFAKVNPIPAVIRSFRSKRQRHRTTRISADIPLEHLEPIINQTQQPIIILLILDKDLNK